MEASPRSGPRPGNEPDHGPDPATLAALRREYGDAGLDVPDLAADPVSMFRRRLSDTAAARARGPSASCESRKGRARAADLACALLSPCRDRQRQFRAEGRAERVSGEESETY